MSSAARPSAARAATAPRMPDRRPACRGSFWGRPVSGTRNAAGAPVGSMEVAARISRGVPRGNAAEARHEVSVTRCLAPRRCGAARYEVSRYEVSDTSRVRAGSLGAMRPRPGTRCPSRGVWHLEGPGSSVTRCLGTPRVRGSPSRGVWHLDGAGPLVTRCLTPRKSLCFTWVRPSREPLTPGGRTRGAAWRRRPGGALPGLGGRPRCASAAGRAGVRGGRWPRPGPPGR